MITQQWCRWDIWFYLFYLWSDKCTKCYFSHLGNPQVHIGTLQKAAAKPCQGEPSLQNAMESAVQSLRWVISWMVLQNCSDLRNMRSPVGFQWCKSTLYAFRKTKTDWNLWTCMTGLFSVKRMFSHEATMIIPASGSPLSF